MNLKVIALLCVAFCSNLYAADEKPIYVVHVNLGNNELASNVITELLRKNKNTTGRKVVLLKPNLDTKENPFAVSRWGHQVGPLKNNFEINTKNAPVFTEKMVSG